MPRTARSNPPDTESDIATSVADRRSPARPAPLEAPDAPVPFGKYYLLERLDDEGRTEVFRAREGGQDGRALLVALKRIVPAMAANQAAIEQFARETEAAAALAHTAIARVLDRGWVGEAYFVAMEHVHGRDLRGVFDLLEARRGRMPVSHAAYVMMRVCEGLAHAHEHQGLDGETRELVHRNVSPQSVLLSYEGDVKLINFGMAKTLGRRAKTVSGIVKGTYGYMSPEQVRGLPIDRRSDIFSCGIVLYELLTGERLFAGSEEFEVLERVRNVDIVPPSSHDRSLPEELERIVLKALAKHADDRYQSAADMYDDLQAFLFSSGALHVRKELGAWMHDLFGAAAIAAEQARLDHCRDLALPISTSPAAAPAPPAGHLPPAPASVAPPPVAPEPPSHADWDEADTQIDPSAGPDGSAAMQPPPEPGGPPPPSTAAAEHERKPLPSLAHSKKASLGPTKLEPGAAPPVSTSTIIGGVAPPPPRPSADSGQASDFHFGAPAVPAPPRRRRWPLYVALAAVLAACVVAGGVAGFYLSDAEAPDPLAASAGGPSASSGSGGAPGLSDEISGDTGFDLFVEPEDAVVKLDGRVLDMASPMRLRDLPPGRHELFISAPDGYYSQTHTIEVRPGRAELIRIELDPVTVRGRFDSEPPGAEVSLLVAGSDEPIVLGQTPVTHELNPGERYEIVFDKQGHEQVRVEIDASAGGEMPVSVSLTPLADDEGDGGSDEAEAEPDEATVAAKAPSRQRPAARPAPRRRPVRRARVNRAPAARERRADATADRNAPSEPAPAAADTEPTEPTGPTEPETGMLMIGAKPPCRIFVNGNDTGKITPQRDLELPAGRHQIRLTNQEHGIVGTFMVTIKPGETTRLVEDMTDQIP